MSVTRKNGKLLAPERKRKKPKQGKEIRRRTIKYRILVVETMHIQEHL